MPQWDSVPPELPDTEPAVPWLLAGGRQHLPGDDGRSLGVLGARGVQEHGQEAQLYGSHHGRSQHLHGGGHIKSHHITSYNITSRLFAGFWLRV